jgi:hypothetical protein
LGKCWHVDMLLLCRLFEVAHALGTMRERQSVAINLRLPRLPDKTR